MGAWRARFSDLIAASRPVRREGAARPDARLPTTLFFDKTELLVLAHRRCCAFTCARRLGQRSRHARDIVRTALGDLRGSRGLAAGGPIVALSRASGVASTLAYALLLPGAARAARAAAANAPLPWP